jgi:hypothetical protein
MAKKWIIYRWEKTGPKSSPKGTAWVMPRFTDILQRWHDDPKIGTVGDKRAFAVISKALRLCSTQELIDWKFDGVKAEKNPFAHAAQSTDFEETIPAADTARRQGDKPEPPDDLSAFMAALNQVCENGADEKETRRLWWAVANKCGDRPTPDVPEIVDLVYQVIEGRRKVHNTRPINTELMRQSLDKKIEQWQQNRTHAAAQQAKAKRFERDDRINRLIGILRALESNDVGASADATAEENRATLEAVIQNADLEELAEATRILSAQATRAG